MRLLEPAAIGAIGAIFILVAVAKGLGNTQQNQDDAEPPPLAASVTPGASSEHRPLDVLTKPHVSDIHVLNRPLLPACSYTNEGCPP